MLTTAMFLVGVFFGFVATKHFHDIRLKKIIRDYKFKLAFYKGYIGVKK